jgi:hypothetical protein
LCILVGYKFTAVQRPRFCDFSREYKFNLYFHYRIAQLFFQALLQVLFVIQRIYCILGGFKTEKTMEKTGIELAVDAAGGQVALANLIGNSQALVWSWLKQGYVPVLRAVEVEQASGVPRIKLIDPRIAGIIVTPAAI